MVSVRDYQRYARKGNTTQRGYGNDHQHELKRWFAQWKPGDPCAQCGQPMWVRWITEWRNGREYRVSMIDLGHNADRSGYIGLCHRSCNRREGAVRGNQQRRQAKRWQQARAW